MKTNKLIAPEDTAALTVYVTGRPGPEWPENVVGMVETPATRENGYPFCGQPAPLYRLDGDIAERIGAEGMLYACRTPKALGLPEGWPTVRLPDYQGGWFDAALFEAPVK